MARWLQLPLYLGLILAQCVYVYHFYVELSDLIGAVMGNQSALEHVLSAVSIEGTIRPTKLTESTIMLVVLVLIVKFAAIAALARANTWPALLIAPLLGRAAMVGVFLTTPYVREHGLGSAQAQHLQRRTAIWILVACAAGVLALAPSVGWLLLGVTVAGVYLLRRLMIKRIGGTTGDTLGATCEIIEALILVTWVLVGVNG